MVNKTEMEYMKLPLDEKIKILKTYESFEQNGTISLDNYREGIIMYAWESNKFSCKKSITSQKKIQVLELYKNKRYNENASKIAKRLNISPTAVINILHSNGIKPSRKGGARGYRRL